MAQEHEIAKLQNLSTVATFFSGVTATMVGFSYTNNDTTLGNAVNVFWFMSLILR
jgi:WD repeat-containing protein 26